MYLSRSDKLFFSCVAGAVSAVITGYMGRICLCKYVCLMHGGLSRLSALEAVSLSPCHRPLSRATGPEPDSNSSPRCVCVFFSLSHTPFPIAMHRSVASVAHKHADTLQSTHFPFLTHIKTDTHTQKKSYIASVTHFRSVITCEQETNNK